MTLSHFILLGRTAMECSWSSLSPSGRSAGARSGGAVHPSTPARLACCLCAGGLALPARCPRPWPETQQFPQEWITNKKTNKSYLRSFLMQLSCPVSYSWQFILHEFSHPRFQWLMWWTFYPFPGKSPARSSTPPCHFPQGSHSLYAFI